MMGAGVCYRCGKVGHMSRDCKEMTNMYFHRNQFGHVKSECPKLVGRVVQAPAIATLQITDGKNNHNMSSESDSGFDLTISPNLISGKHFLDDEALKDFGFFFNLWLDPDIVFLPQLLSSFSQSKENKGVKT
ncbi:hypothetical protein LXL04_033639 [Taraxacum kok-saghyz]